jgi:hypothetical protein
MAAHLVRFGDGYLDIDTQGKAAQRNAYSDTCNSAECAAKLCEPVLSIHLLQLSAACCLEWMPECMGRRLEEWRKERTATSGFASGRNLAN